MYAGQTDSGVQEVEAAAAAGGGSSVGAAPGGADPALTRGAYVCCCCCTLLPVLLLPLGLIGALTASGFTGGAGEATVGTKVGLSEVDPLAVCNDGTESGYYFSPASETAHERKWLVWLQGGALCADEKGCTARMENTPDWMSSAAWPDSHEYSGVLEQSDPTFGGWNQAVVEYCTSDLYLGDREASAETFNWHFRGQRVVKAVLKSLQAKGLRSGDTLVLSGCSAGAMGATVLCDFVQGWLEPTVTDLQLACVLDSPLPVIDVEGLKQAQPGFGASVRGWLDLWGVRGLLHPGCTEGRSAADSWKCLYPEYVVAELSTPWFMSANRFDAFGAALEESGASMLNDQFDYLSPFNDPDMNAWGKAQQVVSDGLPTADQPDAAVFQAGCAMHCGMQAPLYGNVNAGDGTTMRDAIQSWYTAIGSGASVESRRWVDTEDFMAARGSCYGYSDFWVSLSRSIFVVWLGWAIHLTQVLRGQKDVTTMLQDAAKAALTAAGRPELLPKAAFGPRENKIAWGTMWLVVLVTCMIGRAI